MPVNENERLAELFEYEILDTVPEEAFDDITLLAAHICETPIALLSFVDEERQWFKSRIGLEETETSRDIAFCSHAVAAPEAVMVVNDAPRDKRFVDNPLVTGGPEIRFYAGAPLVTDQGNALGTLCVVDQESRQLTDEQITALQALARRAMDILEMRRLTAHLERQIEACDCAHQETA